MGYILAVTAIALLLGDCDATPDALDAARSPSQAELIRRARQAASVPLFALLTLTAQQQLRDARTHEAPLPPEPLRQLVEEARTHLDLLHGYLSPAQHEEAERIYHTLERLSAPGLAQEEAEWLDEENFRRLNALLRDLRQSPRG